MKVKDTNNYAKKENEKKIEKMKAKKQKNPVTSIPFVGESDGHQNHADSMISMTFKLVQACTDRCYHRLSLYLSLYSHCFSPTSWILRSFYFPSYFGITRRNIKNTNTINNLYLFTKKLILYAFFSRCSVRKAWTKFKMKLL